MAQYSRGRVTIFARATPRSSAATGNTGIFERQDATPTTAETLLPTDESRLTIVLMLPHFRFGQRAWWQHHHDADLRLEATVAQLNDQVELVFCDKNDDGSLGAISSEGHTLLQDFTAPLLPRFSPVRIDDDVEFLDHVDRGMGCLGAHFLDVLVERVVVDTVQDELFCSERTPIDVKVARQRCCRSAACIGRSGLPARYAAGRPSCAGRTASAG
jgi:hypothetical protein